MTIPSSIPSPLLPSPSLRLPSPSLSFPRLPTPSLVFDLLRSPFLSFLQLRSPFIAFAYISTLPLPPFTSLVSTSYLQAPTPHPSSFLRPSRCSHYALPTTSHQLAHRSLPAAIPPSSLLTGHVAVEKRGSRGLSPFFALAALRLSSRAWGSSPCAPNAGRRWGGTRERN